MSYCTILCLNIAKVSLSLHLTKENPPLLPRPSDIIKSVVKHTKWQWGSRSKMKQWLVSMVMTRTFYMATWLGNVTGCDT